MLPDITDPAAIAEAMKYLTAKERAELDVLLTEGLPLWMPQIGPQSEALNSPADIIFYGGQAGGGKTDLLLGAALTTQEHSIIFRRESVQLVGIEERMTKILGTRHGYNSTIGVWRLPGGRVLELGSVKEPDDWMKYQGRPHDLKGFDEITHFLELQFRTLIGWMRSDIHARLDEGDERMKRIEESLGANTTLTKQVASDTADLVEFARAAAWIGKMAKPFSYIATIGGAIAATWVAVKK